MRLLALTVLAGMVAVIGGVLMLGWLYEGPRRLLKIAVPKCRDCQRFLEKVY